jgi:CBS domain-containing protein
MDLAIRRTRLRSVFQCVPLASLPRIPSVVEISSSGTLAEAVSLLTKNKILCMPVRCPLADSSMSETKECPGQWAQNYLGMISVFDILAFVLKAEQLNTFDKLVATFGQTAVIDVLGLDQLWIVAFFVSS